jgi:tetratricopeptide (TPR) repeat protein
MSERSKKKAGQRKAAAMHSSAPVSSAVLNDRWLVPGVCVFLAAMVWAVFGQTLGYEFVSYDDNQYVCENPVVQKGLTWEGFRWALTYGGIGHWHPLTWLSHMLDCQLYGLNPGGPHLTNVLLHTATTILLFLILRQMTGFLWRSAFVAAVFAIHPLRAESVAWVAERKDVLSAFFFMLTLWAYVRYAQRRTRVESRESRAKAVPNLDSGLWTLDYYLVLLFFALGLLSKNMLVTMPFVLLLLDYWPLGRLSSFTPKVLFRLVVEKIPLFVLTVASCVATALVSEKLTAADKLPLGLRLENAVVSYVTYLWQMIHPVGLAAVYPNPENYLPLWQVAGALGLLLAITGAVFALRQTRPYLVIGWLWYVGMMVPVIGFVQISYYAHADRYTYLPQIGLYLLLTWVAADLCAGWRYRRWMLGGLSTLILVALVFCARTQTSYWRNGELLWTHTVACTSDNFIGHNNLGIALRQKGSLDEAITQYQQALQIKPDFAAAHNGLGDAFFLKGSVDEAIAQFQKALEIQPNYADAHYNLGIALRQKGGLDEAITHYQQALQIKPDYAEAHNSLGDALFQKGSVDEAIVQFQKVLEIQPNYVDAHYNLGVALAQKGRLDEAIAQYQKAVQIKPDYAEAHNNLGYALLQKGRMGEAITQYQKALEIKPGFPEALNNLAWALAAAPQASLRNGSKAVELAEQANQLAGGESPMILHTLAVAYAEVGRFSDAIRSAQKANELAQAAGQPELAAQINGEIKLFEAGRPYHLESK